MSAVYDAVVVGAGIVGAACAEALSRGGLRVLVVDRGVVGAGATAAGMGHVVVMDDSEAQFALTSYSQQLWDALERELPAEVEFERAGSLWVAADGEEMQEVRRKHAYYSARGVKTEILDGAAVAEAEPNLRRGLEGGLRVPGDSVVYPPCAARFFLDRAQAAGAKLRLGLGVQQMLPEGGVVLSDGTRIEAGLSVDAMGAASPRLTPGLNVRPRKGHLVITDRYPGYARHQIVELGYLKSAHSTTSDSVAFNIQPRKTGQMLIGSSRQFNAVDGRVEMPILSRMLRRAAEYMPDVGTLAAIRVWTGNRAATPDKLPLIGRSASAPRIWHATGHEGLGITTSLATGAILADLVLGRDSAIDPAPYDPARFAGVEVAHG